MVPSPPATMTLPVLMSSYLYFRNIINPCSGIQKINPSLFAKVKLSIISDLSIPQQD
jgi:hypothetical protein